METATESDNDWLQHLANEGYLLLAGRVRRPEEAAVIQQVLRKQFKRNADPNKLFAVDPDNQKNIDDLHHIVAANVSEEFKHIVWTPKMKRLLVLMDKALKFQEPVLLVGDTGCGKTTICQLLAAFSERKLYNVNCHMHSESADFLGSLRPVRVHEDNQKLFEWVDGPLVKAMEEGNFFLIDEISLADDSVLERLNSVLEPTRELLLAEKVGDDEDEKTVVIAHEEFRLMATMNPGGDYGKKELSPALRNRFTEIWCPSDLVDEELMSIIEHNIKHGLYLTHSHGNSGFGYAIIQFLGWYLETEIGKRITVSIRDILTWVNFINTTIQSEGKQYGLSPSEAYIHGACLVFLDGLGTNSMSFSPVLVQEIKGMSYRFLLHQLKDVLQDKDYQALEETVMKKWLTYNFVANQLQEDGICGFGPFLIPAAAAGKCPTNPIQYNLETPATKCNAVRLLRAMQLWKPILLEGSPGVGKTSLVSTLADVAGYKLVRINLSEQTDITDLFGADLPVDGGECGEFAWRDGPLLEALKTGSWILLDELNLASQSVLEGLNSCLDHRGEIFIPELGKTFSVANQSTRIFACQNPFRQGGSRKGLPRSFLNRFVQVFMEPLSPIDLEMIACYLYPTIPRQHIVSIIDFNRKVMTEINEGSLCHNKGYMWDFNLRDIFRFCSAMMTDQIEGNYNPVEYVSLIYQDRMRSVEDKQRLTEMCEAHFGVDKYELIHSVNLHMFGSILQVGNSFIKCEGHGQSTRSLLYPLQMQLPYIESLMKCLEMNWLPIMVGQTASGKSIIPHIVANLTGHTLKIMSLNPEMDTTELLGGFEQADPNRCIEAIHDLIPIIKAAILACVDEFHALRHDFVYSVLSALHKLNSFRRLRSSHSQEEQQGAIRCFTNFLNSVSNALRNVEEASDGKIHPALSALRCALNKSFRNASLKKSHVGGRFEWVDSILVQAALKGHWLLVEDVNLCSPSVLDRLNGLLEPNGVLHVFEQGTVDCNGQQKLRVIKPHPEFRIIFTMNPANGEISPAMRNRGVEIAVPNEVWALNEKSIVPSSWDVTSLMHSRKMCDHLAILYILKVFEKMQSESIAVPSSHDLHNIVDQVVMYLRQKRPVNEAVFSSFDSAFVRNILDQNTQKKSCELLKEEIHQLENTVPMPPAEFQYLDTMLPSIGPSVVNYHLSYLSASIQCKAQLMIYTLKAFLGAYHKQSGDLFIVQSPSITYPEPLMTEEWMNLFALVVKVFVQSCSPREWEMFRLWFGVLWSDILNKLTTPGDSEEDMEASKNCQKVLHLLQNLIEDSVSDFQSFSTTGNLVQTMGTISRFYLAADMNIDIDDLPFDPRWNPQLLHRIMKSYLKKCHDCILDVDSLKKDIDSSCNRFQLLLFLAMSKHLETELPKLRKQKYRSLHELSASVAHMQAPSALRSVVANIVPLASTIHSVLKHELEQSEKCYTSKEFWQVYEIIYLYRQFLKFCYEPIVGDVVKEHISTFALHCSKLIKKISLFFTSVPYESKCPDGFPEELNSAIKSIGQYMELQNTAAQITRLKTFKAFGYPSAFQNETCAKIFLDALVVNEKVNIYSLIGLPSRLSDLKVVITNGVKWNNDLVTAVYFSLKRTSFSEKGYSLSNVITLLHEIKLQLQDLNLIASDDDDDDIMEICQNPAATPNIEDNQLARHIELLPFWHYLFIHAESIFLCCTAEMRNAALKGFSSSSTAKKKSISENFLLDLGVKRLSYDPVHLGQLLSLYMEEKKGLFSLCLSSFLHAFQYDPFAGDHELFYSWNKDIIKKQEHSSADQIISWKKHSPLLSIACLKLFSNSCNNGLTSFPLGSYYEKKEQMENVKNALWKCRTSLGSKTVWHNMASIASCWFDDIVAIMSTFITISVGASLEDILNQIWKSLELSEILPYGNGNILIEAKNSVFNMTAQLNEVNGESLELNWSIAMSFAKVGLLSYMLFAPLYVHDPEQKRIINFKIHKAMKKGCSLEWNLHDWISESMNDRPLSEMNSDIHPFISGLSDWLQQLSEKLEKKEQMLSYRPHTNQFAEVKAEIERFLQYLGSPKSVCSVISSMEAMKSQLESGSWDEEKWKSLSSSMITQSENLKSFVECMISNFPFYRDLIFPFITGIEMVLVSFKMFARCISYASARQKFTSVSNMHFAESCLIKLCSFPTLKQNNILLKPLELATFLSSEATIKSIAWMKITTGLSGHDGFVYKLLKSALLELINDVTVLKRTPAKDIMDVANPILKYFYEAMEHEEQEIQAKKDAEEKVYIHKVRTYGSDPVEESSQDKMAAYFPSFEQEFEEDKGFSLDETKLDVVLNVDAVGSTSSLKSEDKFDLWCHHATLVVKLLALGSDCGKIFDPVVRTVENPDYISPFLLRYEVLQSLLPVLGDIDSYIDPHLIGGHLLSATILQLQSDVQPSSLNLSRGMYLDVYHDSCPSEVLEFIPLLKALSSRIVKLLKEFPENPVLLHVLKIARRIESFPITNPFIKFVTGLQFVLEAAQIWEENAHKGVSLQPELGGLTQKLIHCRKLEYKCWSYCLVSIMQKNYVESAKWWFNIYALIFDNKDDDVDGILATLQQFIEDAPIGQFCARLAILQTFFYHLCLKVTSGAQKKMKDILFNVYTFYKQFLPNIESKVVEIRKPIEKEVKDFLKISKWNDSNFHSIKKSVEKTHQTLHKCMHKFEIALKEPSRKYFTTTEKSKLGDPDLHLMSNLKVFVSPKILPVVSNQKGVIPSISCDPQFDKVVQYSKKSRKFCKKITSHFKLAEDIKTLDEFADGIIEMSQDLKALEVKQDSSKEAQLKQYRHNVRMKRKALDDIFKQFQAIGLSYRKGGVYWEKRSSNQEPNAMLVAGFDLLSWNSYDAAYAPEANLSASWAEADRFYCRSIAQFAVLDTCLNSPTKKLDTYFLTRFNGFGGHLLKNIVHCRKKLVCHAESASAFSESLCCLVTAVSDKSKANIRVIKKDETTYYPSQEFVSHWRSELCSLLSQAAVALDQLDILLRCCPQATEEHALSLHPHVPSVFSSMLKEDQHWTRVTCAFRNTLDEVRANIMSVSPMLENESKLYSWDHLNVIKNSLKQLVTTVGPIADLHVLHAQKGVASSARDSNFTSFLLKLRLSINEKWKQFSEELSTSSKMDAPANDEVQDVVFMSDRLLKRLRKAIGSTFVFIESEHSAQSNSLDNPIENLFTKNIVANVGKLSDCLNIFGVTELFQSLVKKLSIFEHPELVHVFERYILSIVPIVQQYSQLLKLYLHTSVVSYRTSCKLLSSMLETFIEFAQEGFGSPPAEDGDSTESGTKFQDIEQGGLGEGEGTKDVSKDIESEDQLEGAMQEGQEQNNEPSSQLKDEKDGIEMSEDFDGELHDPEAEGNEDGEESDDDKEDEDEENLEKQMGDVNGLDADKVDEKIWDEESENEEEEETEDLESDACGKGVAENEVSELVAKDEQAKEFDKPRQDKCPELKNEGEYDEDHQDPFADSQPPFLEPEVLELPEELEMGSDAENDEGEKDKEDNPMEIDTMKEMDDEATNEYNDLPEDEQEGKNDEKTESDEVSEAKDEEDGGKEGKDAEPEMKEDENVDDNLLQENDEQTAPSEAPPNPTDAKACGSKRKYSGSDDTILPTETPEDWEGGGDDNREQHHEGQANANEYSSIDAAQEGGKSVNPEDDSDESGIKRKRFKASDQNRSLGKFDQSFEDKSDVKESSSDKNEDVAKTDSKQYEHVKDDKETGHQALDTATKEQALEQRFTGKMESNQEEDDDDVIALDSSSDEEFERAEDKVNASKFSGSAPSRKRDEVAASEIIPLDEEVEMDESREPVSTLTVVHQAHSTIHTQYNLWSSLSLPHIQNLRHKVEDKLSILSAEKTSREVSHILWRNIEMIVSPLVQELCEQLRLALEPTKMAKLRGDYRTGKRLNMKKIIPYIASQFRKDKIWLRRTKPSKRQYQIMLAVDDSLSMSDNHSKELAFESLALLSKSLSLLEAGELGVVSFGEDVRLLHGLGQPFTSTSGAHILEAFKFTQKKTRICQLVNCVTDTMIEAGGAQSKMMSREVSQLLVIISDGRGVFNEGEEALLKAVRRARMNSIFMLFVVLDNPTNKDSIMDIQSADFNEKGEVQMRPYMEKFPFPFYIILRTIESLPQVLGEALRQWFELMTSAER